MTNDPRDPDATLLRRALHTLGRDPALRRELMEWLVGVESRFPATTAVRDEVTGPVIDALHDDADRYEKSLADGTRFEFYYRTKIAREFLLSEPSQPEHVWEPQTTRLLCHLAARSTGDVLIGGAYFGDHAVVLGRQLLAQGRRVHCFEPNDEQRRMLQHNGALNALTNLEVHDLGLWSASSVTLRLAGFDSFANSVPAPDGEEGFPTVCIDDYLAAAGSHISVLMLDIEGAEYQALTGARRTLESDRPTVVFEVHRDYVDWTDGLEKTAVCRLLTDHGYSLFALRDLQTNHYMGGTRIELIPAATVYLDGPSHGFNMLAIPPGMTLEDPTAEPLFRIVNGVSPKLLVHKDPRIHHPREGFPELGGAH